MEENFKKILKTIRQLITNNMSKDIPVLSLTLGLLKGIPMIDLLTVGTILVEIKYFSTLKKLEKLAAYYETNTSFTQPGQLYRYSQQNI
ncbi:hypothetical protein [Lutispora sp.]|uniref:hypothetical protein n=1 Tax=Lutispora sp. TaxID=2828727 RepID=UPI003562CEF6